MIAATVLALAAIIVLAVVVRVLDSARAADWREVAADRRQSWEARHPTPVADERYRAATPATGR